MICLEFWKSQRKSIRSIINISTHQILKWPLLTSIRNWTWQTVGKVGQEYSVHPGLFKHLDQSNVAQSYIPQSKKYRIT